MTQKSGHASIDSMSSRDEETKTRILNAVIRLMTENEGKGVRMGDIAKAANISRQGIYLHFPSRTQLLEAATRHKDSVLNLESRLKPSQEAQFGMERLNAYIEFWGNYIPEIFSMARALILAQNTDEAAASAWRDRMSALREGCLAAIQALHVEGILAEQWTVQEATDLFWTLLSVENWQQLTQVCGWSTPQYINHMQATAKLTFVKPVH